MMRMNPHKEPLEITKDNGEATSGKFAALQRKRAISVSSSEGEEEPPRVVQWTGFKRRRSSAMIADDEAALRSPMLHKQPFTLHDFLREPMMEFPLDSVPSADAPTKGLPDDCDLDSFMLAALREPLAEFPLESIPGCGGPDHFILRGALVNSSILWD